MQHAAQRESESVALESRAEAERGGLKLKPARRRLGDDAVLALNLLLFLAAGTVLCVWFWRNTGWFEELGAVLAFSGGLSWIAVAMRIVPEAKVAALQEVFFARAFEDRGAVWLHAAALALVVAGTFCFATVQIEPLHETAERPVVVERADEASGENRWATRLDEGDFDVLLPGQTLRMVVPVWWRWQTRAVVAVSGYPEKTVTLSPWQRSELVAPSSFRRPVVLLRPTVGLMAEVALGARELVVVRRREGRPVETRTLAIDGHAVWLGCDEQVEVPERWRDAWAREDGWTMHMAKWLFPRALRFADDLAPGDRLEISVRGPSGEDWRLSPAHVVGPHSARAEFLPEIVKIGRE